jgi:transposase
VRHLFDAIQDVRIRYRQELLTDKRLQYVAFQLSERKRKQYCKENQTTFIANKFIHKTPKLSNGETALELLSRTRFMLFKYPQDRTETQRERAVALFKIYPEIEKSYKLCCLFRDWYSKKNVGRTVDKMRQELQCWYSEVEREGVMEMKNFCSLVERHEGLILNYFVNGDTNAIAEAMNSKIQRMITLNKGTRNKEFFLHKMKKMIDSTSK